MPDRIYAQYRKPKLSAWYDIVPDTVSDLFKVHERTRLSYDVDNINITSYELDVLGRIVGVNRSFELNVRFNPSQFGGVDVQFGGIISQFGSSTGEISQELSNEIFKLLIKSKISKNNNEATLDGISAALQVIVNQPTVRVIDNEDMTFSVSFGSQLSEIERIVLTQFDVLPRPQGVEFLGFVEETQITQFGGLYGFGDNRAQFGFFII